MRKILLIIILVLVLAPFLVQAGLVPCGTERDAAGNITNPCQLCHVFVLFENIVDFLLFKIVPSLAILMIAIGGFMFMFAAGNPSTLTRAKSILTTTAIALLIIYGAWLIVDLILTFPGLINPEFGDPPWDPSKWFQIDCQIR